jgi:serine/threonine protein kinase
MPDANLHIVAQEVCIEKGLKLLGYAGGGTFKETFRTEDLRSGKALALKVFRPDYSSPERESREIDAMTRCNHPNLGGLLHIGPFNSSLGKHLFALEEFLSGGTLTDRIEKRLLESDDIYFVGQKLISAVGHMAEIGLVHRDLKPDNIMFRSESLDPIIVDFGIVRDLGKSSLTPTFVPQGPCSPYFAAPEQLRNEKELIDWRTDQFALGIVLAMAGSGVHPYEEVGGTPSDTITRVSMRKKASEKFEAWASASNLRVLTKMVAPWPVQRYRSPVDLVEAWNRQRTT